MRDAGYLLALIGTFVLLAAVAAWWKIFRQPETQPTAQRLEQDIRGVNSAAIATFLALALSAVAAILAVLAWLS